MIEREMFFDGWEGVVRVLVLALVAYMALLVMLRFSRKRSLAKMNVFDFVYVVIIGEVMAISIVDERVALAEGVAAVALLIGLQILLSWLTTRSNTVERLINGEPTLLLRNGRFLHGAMHAQRITENEIRSAAREKGMADLEDIEAVVLETNGSLSIVHHGTPSSGSTLGDVPGADDTGRRGESGQASGERRRRDRRRQAASR